MGKKLYEHLSSLTTESRNSRSRNLDRLTILQTLRLINDEDHRVPRAIAAVIPQIVPVVKMVVQTFQSGGRLIYAGAGTSGRLGVLDAAECPPTFGVSPRLVQGLIAGGRRTLIRSREGVEDDVKAAVRDIGKIKPCTKDTVIGIAASARTPYALAVLEYAKKQGANTAFIVCNRLASKPKFIDAFIVPIVGPEVLTGSTRMKAGTACKLILNMITTTAMVQTGKCYGNLMVDLRATSKKLAERSRRILVETLGVDYRQAGELLKRSHGEVKTAIAMSVLSVDYTESKRRLVAADGRLSELLSLSASSQSKKFKLKR